MLVYHRFFPSIKIWQYLFLHPGGGRYCESRVSGPTEHNVPGLEAGLVDMKVSALTIRPPHLQAFHANDIVKII